MCPHAHPPKHTLPMPLRDMEHVVGRIMLPKDVHVLIPRTYEYMTLRGTRDFVDVIKNYEMGR